MNFNPDPAIFVKEEIALAKRADESGIYLNKKSGYLTCKRISDIIGSLIFIVGIFSWLMPVIALLIKLNSKGPVFFLQRRVGRAGRSFTCFKFRTMVVNREADRLQALHDDGRITGIGRILRKLNLDELPQFFNVLIGDMSIIGPRPHMHADYNRFSSVIPAYTFRNLVRPGITGLAQIKGYSGPAIDTESIFGRYQWDAFYVRNAGFLLDMRILRKTATQELLAIARFASSAFIVSR